MAFVDIVGSENRLKRSQDQSSAVWQELGSAVKTANVVAGPDGSISGGKVAFAGATNSALMQAGNGAMVSGKVYTWSLWVKGVVGGETFKLLLSDGVSATFSSEYTATTKWKRYSVTKTSGGTNVGAVQIRNATTDTGKEVYIWGGQLEESKTASSYKLTTINVVTPSAGSDGVWEFEDSATVSNTYPDSADGADTTVAGGVRTYNKPGDENGGQELSYLRARIKGEINLLTNSQDFNVSWSAANSSVSVNTTVAPDGTTTAETLTFTTTGYGSVFKSETVVAGQPYTFSVFAKAGVTNILSLEQRLGNSVGVDVSTFNLSTGTIISNGDADSTSITDEGNGWFRCSTTTNSSPDTTETFIIGRGTSGSVNDTIFIWGAMLNNASIKRKYIKTTNAVSSTIERGEVSKTYYDNQ